MKIKTFLLTLSILLFSNNTVLAQAVDYSNDKTYKELYNAMHRAFNDGDSTKFFPRRQHQVLSCHTGTSEILVR